MSETERSPWAPPTDSLPKQSQPAEQPTPQLIEVPDWIKQDVAELATPTPEAPVNDKPFSIGKEVIVKRNGKNGAPNYNEGGWKIIDDDATVRIGKTGYMVGVVVEKEIDGETFQKSIPLNELMDLNPNAEKERVALSDAQEDLADEAIEGAIGLHDPSEQESVDRYLYLKEALPPVTRGETEASQKYYDKFVTETNKQISLDFLSEAVKADPEISGILREAGLNPTDMAAVDAIRENPDVRYKIAKRLTQKLDTLADRDPHDFGYRIADNSPKNLKVNPQTGKQMLSRTYAVDMALKMLGGEFDERREDNDFARDQDDRVAIGQHRHAARTTIMSRYA